MKTGTEKQVQISIASSPQTMKDTENAQPRICYINKQLQIV